MNSDNKLNDAFGSSAGPKDHGPGQSGHGVVKPHLEPKERLKVYIALSVLMDAGMTFEAALSVLLKEYKRLKTPDLRKIKAVEIFFGGIATNPNMAPDDIVNLAHKTFGAAFMEPEESAVLSAMGQSVNVVAAFKAAISILEASK
ncbi:hypothetical protein [Mesorhizobium sp. SP-1A]|uniref:hypothetical protein n=1 Tax=Mesorhizobium sp. SP-1A TaxID=3077840 RepID=UPI0028F72C14|nr:hypothetical protein [Mesorhizobium sp. SP-1A]